VRFVVIGGWAARLQGSLTVTVDLDLCYARGPDDLERLARALGPLRVRLRGADRGLPFRLDARTLRAGDAFRLDTDAGPLDLLGWPAGSGGFEALDRGAVELVVEDLSLRVASLPDLIRMKRAAGRPKDLIELEVLQVLLEETDKRGISPSEAPTDTVSRPGMDRAPGRPVVP
jgi:hypothetical protein